MNHRIVSDNTHDLNGITQIIVLINGIALSYSIPKTKKIILSEKTKTEKEKEGVDAPSASRKKAADNQL